MKRTLILGTAVLMGWLALASVSQAQIFVRAPFVRVGVGEGVYVRAPFVNLYVPPAGPVYYPYAPPIIYTAPPPQVVQPVQPQMPFVKDDNAPPQPLQAVQAPTLDSFAKSFQPKAGSYAVTLQNPVTGQPATVNFTLPEGSPRRVIVGRYFVEFVYGLRQFVRIEFDRNGATVIAR